ncbi:MAG TPA: protease HtpX [Ottowia sp.]|jgi:heat shock protein HtpX|nr:MAG: zinc metalloprotease HtpX [Burkholderiales bacterium 68-10]HMT17387.1 protease HtpX [Ottowia sp.]HMT58001.1 protease HtpX [Ottowia sp.]HMT63954.1 protease HtpX [Ottowia sp.]HMT84016.1 protease HtpX [Ottowia sp.]
MKRILLFVLTNLAVMVVVGVVTSLLGVGRYTGTNTGQLMVFSLVVGFSGAIVSLLMSKSMAKMSMGVQIIEQPRNADEAWIVDTVRRFADKAGIGMPEVGIYEGEPNAFATGAFKNSALVAVSTGLLRGMTREEVEAVIGHEVAHVANGDMVTMALIQGVMNTFVVFASRVIGSLVDGFLRRDNESSGPGIGYYVTTIVLDILFGVLASIIVAWFSRQREFRADAGAARMMGQPNSMINALARLGGMHAEGAEMPKNLAAMGIAGGIGKLFSTHPPMEERIAALRAHQG